MNKPTFIYILGFGKNAPAPMYLRIGQHFGEIIDGLTGLIMAPFGRYGTNITQPFIGAILRSRKHYRK